MSEYHDKRMYFSESYKVSEHKNAERLIMAVVTILATNKTAVVKIGEKDNWVVLPKGTPECFEDTKYCHEITEKAVNDTTYSQSKKDKK